MKKYALVAMLCLMSAACWARGFGGSRSGGFSSGRSFSSGSSFGGSRSGSYSGSSYSGSSSFGGSRSSGGMSTITRPAASVPTRSYYDTNPIPRGYVAPTTVYVQSNNSGSFFQNWMLWHMMFGQQNNTGGSSVGYAQSGHSFMVYVLAVACLALVVGLILMAVAQ